MVISAGSCIGTDGAISQYFQETLALHEDDKTPVANPRLAIAGFSHRQ